MASDARRRSPKLTDRAGHWPAAGAAQAILTQGELDNWLSAYGYCVQAVDMLPNRTYARPSAAFRGPLRPSTAFNGASAAHALRCALSCRGAAAVSIHSSALHSQLRSPFTDPLSIHTSALHSQLRSPFTAPLSIHSGLLVHTASASSFTPPRPPRSQVRALALGASRMGLPAAGQPVRRGHLLRDRNAHLHRLRRHLGDARQRLRAALLDGHHVC